MTNTADRLFDDPSFELPEVRRGAQHRALLDRVAGLQRSSAALLRGHGRDAEAAKAEIAASRLRLTLDEPKATERMLASVRAVRETSDYSLLLERALDGAMALLGAALGNIQLRYPRSGGLAIVTQAGFGGDFLEHFAWVADDSSACGRAARERSQVVIVDVNRDDAFEPHRRIAAASRFRAVQSTPLVDREDRLVGVVSTHFRGPHRPSARDLLLLSWYGEQIGDAVTRNGHPTSNH